MNFAKRLARLTVAAEDRQRGRDAGSVVIDQQDLRELLCHFGRVDALHRDSHARIEALEAENAQLKESLDHFTERIQWILAACEIDRDARVELEGLVKESEGI